MYTLLKGVHKKYTTSISNYSIPETKQHKYMCYVSSGIPLILGVKVVHIILYHLRISQLWALSNLMVIFCFKMIAINMNRSAKKRYITRLLFVKNG